MVKGVGRHQLTKTGRSKILGISRESLKGERFEEMKSYFGRWSIRVCMGTWEGSGV